MTPHRGGGTGGHPTTRRLASAALACVLVSGWDAGTQRPRTSPDADCVAAAEPNDDVDHAQVLPATETCVIATHENGAQDMFMWTVTPEAAGQRWTMTTTGIPGQAETLQVHRLHVDEAGVLTGSDNLASIGTGPGAGATLENLMFPAGEYLVGIGFTGAGPYELHIAPGDAAPAAAEVEPNDSQDQATPLSGELAASGDRAGSTSDWYSWTVDAVAAEQPWELLVQGAVGTSPGVRLIDEDAVPLFQGAPGSDGVLRVPDIQLPAGTYFLEVAGASEEPRAVRGRTASRVSSCGRHGRRTERPTGERGARRPGRGRDDAARAARHGRRADRRRHLSRDRRRRDGRPPDRRQAVLAWREQPLAVSPRLRRRRLAVCRRHRQCTRSTTSCSPPATTRSRSPAPPIPTTRTCFVSTSPLR